MRRSSISTNPQISSISEVKGAVQPIAAIPQLAELNIGHYLIGEAIFDGLENAVRRMRDLMDAAR